MKLKNLLPMLIVMIAIMGFSTTGFAWEEIGMADEYPEEEVEFEATEEEEYVAEAEYEAESMEEEEYKVEEERVEPVKGEDWDIFSLPELY
ncbi:MAG: hypothetical protein ACE5GU_05750 [Candidatus Scalinduaceae bacterium]